VLQLGTAKLMLDWMFVAGLASTNIALGRSMNSECRLEHQSVQPTLSIRFRAERAGLAAAFRRAYACLGGYLGERGVAPLGTAFAIYHTMDNAHLDIEAGFVVDRAQPGKGEIRSGRLHEGDIATAILTGPHESVGSAYSALKEWARGRGLTSAGPFTEFYLDDPAVTPPAQRRTKVALPVGPA